MIYWFTGASIQAVTTGAYRAVEFIKRNIKLDGSRKASVADSKKVVEICTQYAQKGMFNIFLAVFFATLAFACVEPFFFIGYLISIALFGLYQAIFMANAGGAWDNAKKIVEVDLKEKGTPLHDGHRGRRHRGRPVQGHLVGGDEPDHQVHDAVRPAGGGAGGQHFPRSTARRWRACWRRPSTWCLVIFVLAVLLRHADPGRAAHRRAGRRAPARSAPIRSRHSRPSPGRAAAVSLWRAARSSRVVRAGSTSPDVSAPIKVGVVQYS